MSQTTPPESPFLGGGPRFNQAGNNTPMPGEKRAEAPPPLPFGGPRVWAGTAVVIVLLLVLFLVYGKGLAGVQSTGGRPSVSASDKPADDPDGN